MFLHGEPPWIRGCSEPARVEIAKKANERKRQAFAVAREEHLKRRSSGEWLRSYDQTRGFRTTSSPGCFTKN